MRHFCVLRVSFWCLELCVFLFLVHVLGSVEKERPKASVVVVVIVVVVVVVVVIVFFGGVAEDDRRSAGRPSGEK